MKRIELSKATKGQNSLRRAFYLGLWALTVVGLLLISCNAGREQSAPTLDSLTEVDTIKLFQEAEELHEIGRYYESYNILSQLIVSSPKNGQYYYARGRALFFLNEIELSIIDYKKSLRLGYDSGKVCFHLGLVYDAVENDSSAYYFDLCKKLDPAFEMPELMK